jgi:hypothetical protein
LEGSYDNPFPPADEREVEARDYLREFLHANRERVLFFDNWTRFLNWHVKQM